MPDAADDDRGGAPEGGAGPEKSYPTSGVRYGAMNWIGEFRLPPQTVLKPGVKVVVQSDRGIEIGEQVSLTCHGCTPSVNRDQIKRYVDTSGPEFYRLKAGKILREASPQDIDEHERLNRHVRDDVNRCVRVAAELNLDMKVITAEHLLGGERIVFYFRSDGRVDFRELVRGLAQDYQTRIEMRQVGARDEARLIADYEVCGRECCCKNFLKKLRPITMRMAKLQKSTLDPSKVSGRCGRLRCCLRYEHLGYDELLRKLPRLGARVQTKIGPATVTDRQILTQLVLVRTDDERELAVPAEEISPLDTPAAKSTAPAPEPEAPAAAADQQSADEQGRPPRRRRSRRRRKLVEDGLDQRPETAAPNAPVSPAPPETDPASDRPAEDAGGSDPQEARPSRRRRRRRRPRDRSDTTPDADEI